MKEQITIFIMELSIQKSETKHCLKYKAEQIKPALLSSYMENAYHSIFLTSDGDILNTFLNSFEK